MTLLCVNSLCSADPLESWILVSCWPTWVLDLNVLLTHLSPGWSSQPDPRLLRERKYWKFNPFLSSLVVEFYSLIVLKIPNFFFNSIDLTYRHSMRGIYIYILQSGTDRTLYPASHRILYILCSIQWENHIIKMKNLNTLYNRSLILIFIHETETIYSMEMRLSCDVITRMRLTWTRSSAKHMD